MNHKADVRCDEVVDALCPNKATNAVTSSSLLVESAVVLLLMPRRDDSVMGDSRELVNQYKNFESVHYIFQFLLPEYQQLLIEVPVLCFPHMSGEGE